MSDRMAIEAIDASDRARHDLGDLRPLAESITEIGMLHPVVVTPDQKLVAGGRRLAAARMLGREDVPVTVARSLTTVASRLRAERDENACRVDMTPVEKTELFNRLRDLETPAAKERQGTRTDIQHPAKFAGSSTTGETRDIAAEAAGISHETARKVNEITRTAADMDAPEEVREVAVRMKERIDRPKDDPERVSVDAAHKAVREERTRAAMDAMEPPEERTRRELHRNLLRALSHAGDLALFDARACAQVIAPEEWSTVEFTGKQIAEWFASLTAAKPDRQLRRIK